MKKVLLVTEYLNPPYDEGIKKTVYNLYLELRKRYELQVICRYGFKDDSLHNVDVNPLYFSKEVKDIIKDFSPDTLIYFPFQSATFASYLRLKILSLFASRSNIVFIALQPKPLRRWQVNIVKYIKPKKALTPSPSLKKNWDKFGVENKLIPLLTDLSIFKPVKDVNRKYKLREKYQIPVNTTVISHMGHLNEGRNLRSLIPLQKGGYQVVIVGSSSTPVDAKGEATLKDDLVNNGIKIIDQFIDNIEEIYQLSDVYIFPVVAKNSSIGLPLSILEARACGIPVLTTDYGSVKKFLGDDNGGVFYADPDGFQEEIMRILSLTTNNHKKTNVKNLNNLFFRIIHDELS